MGREEVRQETETYCDLRVHSIVTCSARDLIMAFKCMNCLVLEYLSDQLIN